MGFIGHADGTALSYRLGASYSIKSTSSLMLEFEFLPAGMHGRNQVLTPILLVLLFHSKKLKHYAAKLVLLMKNYER
jgi:hypothetical protein